MEVRVGDRRATGRWTGRPPSLMAGLTTQLPSSSHPARHFVGQSGGPIRHWACHCDLRRISNVRTGVALLVITRFCGGLTTFSTYSAEIVSLLQQGRLN